MDSREATLIRLCKLVAKHRSISASRVSALVGQHGAFFPRLMRKENPSSCRRPTADAVLQAFSDLWPDDLQWPDDIPRPAPSKTDAAA